MNWFELKAYFLNKIAGIYKQEEAEAIFFLICEERFRMERFEYMLKKTELVPKVHQEQFGEIIFQLQQNQPVQHILGEAHFYGRKFKVDKDVLIPRQETEILVDLILKEQEVSDKKILDIGSGSGCISVSLKAERPQFKISSVDVSGKAIDIAKINAKRHKVGINFIQQDILNESLWSGFKDKSLDVVVSNPPYVLQSEKRVMNKNVVDFDPELALYVDDDKALMFYEAITSFSKLKLKKGGYLYFEINEQFGQEVAELCRKNGFIQVQIIKDLQAKDRFVKALKL